MSGFTPPFNFAQQALAAQQLAAQQRAAAAAQGQWWQGGGSGLAPHQAAAAAAAQAAQLQQGQNAAARGFFPGQGFLPSNAQLPNALPSGLPGALPSAPPLPSAPLPTMNNQFRLPLGGIAGGNDVKSLGASSGTGVVGSKALGDLTSSQTSSTGDGNSPRQDVVKNGVVRAITYQCDNCHSTPLTGIRWHCLTCPDFDLCADCRDKAKTTHDPSHEFSAIPIETTLGGLAATSSGGASGNISGGAGAFGSGGGNGSILSGGKGTSEEEFNSTVTGGDFGRNQERLGGGVGGGEANDRPLRPKRQPMEKADAVDKMDSTLRKCSLGPLPLSATSTVSSTIFNELFEIGMEAMSMYSSGKVQDQIVARLALTFSGVAAAKARRGSQWEFRESPDPPEAPLLLGCMVTYVSMLLALDTDDYFSVPPSAAAASTNAYAMALALSSSGSSSSAQDPKDLTTISQNVAFGVYLAHDLKVITPAQAKNAMQTFYSHVMRVWHNAIRHHPNQPICTRAQRYERLSQSAMLELSDALRLNLSAPDLGEISSTPPLSRIGGARLSGGGDHVSLDAGVNSNTGNGGGLIGGGVVGVNGGGLGGSLGVSGLSSNVEGAFRKKARVVGGEGANEDVNGAADGATVEDRLIRLESEMRHVSYKLQILVDWVRESVLPLARTAEALNKGV